MQTVSFAGSRNIVRSAMVMSRNLYRRESQNRRFLSKCPRWSILPDLDSSQMVQGERAESSGFHTDAPAHPRTVVSLCDHRPAAHPGPGSSAPQRPRLAAPALARLSCCPSGPSPVVSVCDYGLTPAPAPASPASSSGRSRPPQTAPTPPAPRTAGTTVAPARPRPRLAAPAPARPPPPRRPQ